MKRVLNKAKLNALISVAAVALLFPACRTTSRADVDSVVRWDDSPDVELAYPLDDESRAAPGRGKPKCPVVQLVMYEGDIVRYHRPVRVNPFFLDRLRLFEEVVREVAVEVYGRPPSAIRHFGTYNCRRVNGRPKLSEHSWGNAIDVSGFEFDAGRGGPVPEAFRINLLEDWGKTRGVQRHHAVFLHRLAERLAERPDIFRGMLGPGAAGHADHFHFDVGPHRYIKIGSIR